jgi:hypothetical protein
VVVSVLLGVARLVGAQASTSSGFVGLVHDQSGGVMPGATVTARQLATGYVQTVVSDAEGRYRIPSLPQGEYELDVSLPGFGTQVKSGLVLTVGRTMEVNFTLAVGAVSDEVTVAGNATLVETQSSSVAGLVSGQEIRILPLSGRSFNELITLSPSTVLFSQRTTNAFQGTAGQYSAGGARPNQTRMVVDGAELSGAGGNHTSMATASGKLLGVEGIQEFQVITNNADASYGKKPGGQVSIVTRAGTNDVSGTGFGFLRDERFDAKDYFDEEKTELDQYNVGFTLGGPISRDHTFFFLNYERYTETRGLTLVSRVPTLAVRQGVFPDGTVVRVHPDMVPILDIYPVPAGRDFGDGTAEASTPATLSVRDNYFVTRLDHQFSPQHSLFGRYLIQTGERTDPNDNNIGRFPEVVPFRTALLTASYKAILSPRLVSQTTFSANTSYNRVDYVPVAGITIPPSMIIVPGQTANTNIAVQGGQIPNLGSNTAGGTAEQSVDRAVYQYSQRVSYSRGAHFLDAGTEIHQVQSDQFSGLQVRGTMQFANLRALVQGTPNQIRGPQPGSDGFKNWRQHYVALYLQDAYKVRANLTLNLGLRWEFLSNPTEAQGRTAAWVPDAVTLVYPNEPTVTPKVFSENKSGNWAPRIGLAWDVFGNGQTAVRGGFGVFYAQIESEYRRALGPASPFYNLVTLTNPPFPIRPDAFAAGSLGLLSPSSVEVSPTIPRTTQFNLRVERSLGSDFLVALGYVGSRGSNLGRQTNPQTPPPVLNAEGRLEIPQALMNPRLAQSATHYQWDAKSQYDAMQAEFEKKSSRGLRYRVAFTWSKAIDEGADIIANLTGASAGSSFLTEPSLGRGLAPFDVRRRLSINWNYTLPLGTHAGGTGVLLNDWQLAGLFQAQDGFPFTASSGVNVRIAGTNFNRAVGVDLAAGASTNPVLGGVDQYFDPSGFQLAPPHVIGNLGANTLIGPGLALLDLSVIKRFRAWRGTSAEFRVDVFNALNRANFGLPDGTLFNADGSRRPGAGRITTTTTTPREMQFGVKFLF